MAERVNVRIEMTGHGRGRVFVNDVELIGVKAVAFRASAEKFNVVTLVIHADKVSIDGPVVLNSTSDITGI